MIDLLGYWTVFTVTAFPLVYVCGFILYLLAVHLLQQVTQDKTLVGNFTHWVRHKAPPPTYKEKVTKHMFFDRGIYNDYIKQHENKPSFDTECKRWCRGGWVEKGSWHFRNYKNDGLFQLTREFEEEVQPKGSNVVYFNKIVIPKTSNEDFWTFCALGIVVFIACFCWKAENGVVGFPIHLALSEFAALCAPLVGWITSAALAYFGAIFGMRWLYQLGLKVNSFKEKLDEHIADKEAHK